MRTRSGSLARSALLLLTAIASFLVAPAATAQKLSDRPIVIVVPYTPGTGIDLLARAIGQEISVRWGQTVIIENKPGASGNIGTQAAARAAADGHTLMMTANTFVMNASLFKSLPYDPQKSFAPIIEVATGALALAVHPSLEATSIGDLVKLATAKPGAINYASPGRGTPQHLAMELLKLKTSAALTHIPYVGSAGAIRDIIGGHVSAMFLPLHTVLQLANDKQLRLIAVSSAARSPLAPDVPTLAEQGVAGFDVDLWYGLLAPRETPPEIVKRYNTVINEILAVPAMRTALATQGLIAIGGEPSVLADLIARDQPRWAQVISDAGIVAE